MSKISETELEAISDRRVFTDGSRITPGYGQIDPSTGMQRAYVVLNERERAKGYVEPLRDIYVHQRCGTETRMGQSIAETYAREPSFYDATFCSGCRQHFPVGADGEFVWKGTAQRVGTRGTTCA